MIILTTIIIVGLLMALKIFARLTIGRCTSPVCLVGKTALITGGNSGVGYHTALALAGRGCRVIIADKVDSNETKAKIIKETGNTNIVVKRFDLSSLKSIRKLAEDIKASEERLDILINNAVGVGLGNCYTEDGLHAGMQVNHFGPFLLTHLLVGLLRQSTPSRILFITSVDAFLNNLSPSKLNIPEGPHTILSEFMVYSNSKLCNIITANEFARKLGGTGLTVNSIHPGLVDTPIFRNTIDGLTCKKWQKGVLYFFYRFMLKPFGKFPEESAEAVLYPAIAKEFENVTEKFLVDCKPFPMPRLAKNLAYSKKIWSASEDFVKLTPEEKL